jgi:2-hydroxychromene-2-carboxylate isomerase
MPYLASPPSPGDTITFEIYYGVSSPWACLGAPEAERIARENGLTIHLKPMTVIEENGGIRVSPGCLWTERRRRR